MCAEAVGTTVRPIGKKADSDRFRGVGTSERRCGMRPTCQIVAPRRSDSRTSTTNHHTGERECNYDVITCDTTAAWSEETKRHVASLIVDIYPELSCTAGSRSSHARVSRFKVTYGVFFFFLVMMVSRFIKNTVKFELPALGGHLLCHSIHYAS